jgi:hypothetical protein
MNDFASFFGAADVSGAQHEVEFRAFPRQGEPRWLVEARFRRPWYLKTWPRANRRARLIYRCVWALSLLGLPIASRRIVVPVTSGSPYDLLRKNFARLGIFLGTPGPNRKIVVFAERKDRSVFVKIPVNPASAALVRNEEAALTALALDPALAPLVPKVSREAGHLAVDNIERNGARYGVLSLCEIARVHDLLFARSRTPVSVADLRTRWSRDISAFQNAGPASHPPETMRLIDEARHAADQFMDSLDPREQVECYLAHGDFTRWNVLVARDGSARMIDWELFGLKPRYFDLIHYFVSADVLVSRASAESILSNLRGIARALDLSDEVRPAQWLKYVGLYLACQSHYHAAMYEQQSDLHAQALWQMRTWRESLDSLRAAAAADWKSDAARLHSRTA